MNLITALPVCPIYAIAPLINDQLVPQSALVDTDFHVIDFNLIDTILTTAISITPPPSSSYLLGFGLKIMHDMCIQPLKDSEVGACYVYPAQS